VDTRSGRLDVPDTFWFSSGMRRRDQHFSELRPQRTLADYPGETVNLACRSCDRVGHYAKAKLIAGSGPELGLVNLLNYLARDCPANKPDWQGLRSCRAYYRDLARGG
jgi:hypothetical protein